MDTKKLRQKILDLAIRGKLVPQDPNDEPASVLLERIRAEKERLIAEGKIKRPKKTKSSSAESHYQNFTPPFDIPDSWEWVTLEELGEIITGATPPKDIEEYYGGEIPFFKPTDLEQGIETVNSSDHLSALGYRQSRQLPVNTILITCIGATIGKTGLTKREGSCNQQINAIIPFAQIEPEYIYFSCISEYFQSAIKENASATTLPILNKNNFSGLLLPLPPTQEQTRIIKKIYNLLGGLIEIETSKEKIGAVIAIIKSKILDLAMRGKLVSQDPADESAAEMLLRINPKAKIITDNPHYPQLPENWVLTNIETINEYQSITVNPAYNPTQAFELYSVPVFNTGCPEFLLGNEIGSTKQVVKKDDVLLCKINPHLNRVWEIEKDSEFSQIASSEWIVVRSSILNPSFIKYYFESRIFRKLLCSQVSGVGGSLTRAQPTIVKKYSIPIPPYAEQLRIVKAILSWNMVLDEISNSLN